MTTILIKRGQAEANLPLLDPGEPAITFDSGGKFWIGTPSGNLEISGGGGGASDVDDLTTDTGTSTYMVRVAASGGLEYRSPSQVLGDIGAISGPGGSDTQLQLNNGGVFDGSTNLTWSESNNQLLVGGATAFSPSYTLEIHNDSLDASIALVNDAASDDGNVTSFAFVQKNTAESLVGFGAFSVGAVTRTAGSHDGSFSIGVAVGGTVTPLFTVTPSAINLNPLGVNTDTIIQGDTATNLVVIDAGLESFRVGTTVVGALLDVSPTATIFNNAEADIDFRIAGSGVTNGICYDAGNNRTGFGTATPVSKFELVSGALSSSNYAPQVRVGITAGEYQGFYSTAANVFGLIGGAELDGTNNIARHTSATILTMAAVDGSIRFYTNSGLTAGSNFTPNERMRIYADGGAVLGAPTGASKGAGTLNVATNIYKNNTAYTNPDYALEHWATGKIERFATREGAQDYYCLSMDESEQFVRENLHLPRISRDPAGIFDMADMALEKIEEAHIYIYELNHRIKRLEQLLDLA